MTKKNTQDAKSIDHESTGNQQCTQVSFMAEEKLRFNILDIVRLLAAFAVLFYHYSIYIDSSNPLFPILDFGYLGVNFFFILSGFVITASAQNRNAFEFVKARALRLYPAFIICLLITVIVNFTIKDLSYPIHQILANATILNDYLKIENIDGVYWTLQAEIKFYGCIFLLLLTGTFKYWRYWLSIWLLLAITHHFIKQPFFMGWFISPNYSFYFIGGVSAYLIYLYPRDKLVLSIFLASLIFSYINTLNQASDFMHNVDKSKEIWAGVIVSLFFIFFFFIAKGYLNIARKPYLALLGALSYPLYLIHNQAGKSVIQYLQNDIGTAFAIAVTIFMVIAVSYWVVILERWINKNLIATKTSIATP